MDVSVVGLGKLGLPLAVAFKGAGLGVIGVDINPNVLASITRGESHICEPGVEELLPIPVTDNTSQAVEDTDVTIIIVATPSKPDGSFSLEYVLPACAHVGTGLQTKKGYHLVIISSTVMPGSCSGVIRQRLEEYSGKKAGEDFGLAYVPEFVALGSVLDNFLNPEFILVGADDEQASHNAGEFYDAFVGFSEIPIVTYMSLVNAELAKIALNCYLTTKITFANQLAGICERISGADVDRVTEALGRDSRISAWYLQGGPPYGGPCFPRDDRALEALALKYQARRGLVKAVSQFNDKWYQHIVGRIDIASQFRTPLRRRIGVLGLAFKEDTDCITGSLGLYLMAHYRGWRELAAYDPIVEVPKSVNSAQACVDVSDVVVVTTRDPEFRALTFREGQTVFDCWRWLDANRVRTAGAECLAVGIGAIDD